MVGENLLFNGALNQMLLGIPVWIWLSLLLIILGAFTNVYWYVFFWSPLKPLHGLWIAFWNKKDTVLLSDIDMNLKLTSEKTGKVIFNETLEEAKAGEKDWRDITSGSFGTIGNDIILDMGKWTKPDSDEKIMIEEAADKWNMAHPDDQIHSYYKFMKYCENGNIFVDMPTLMAVSWIRIESAFPIRRNKAAYAGYIRQLAVKMDKDDRKKLENIALYVIIASVAISALMIAGKFLMHKP